MKRAVLYIGIVVLGLFTESEILAQRRGISERNLSGRIASRSNERRDDRLDKSNNRRVTIDTEGRRVVEVKQVVLRSDGIRYFNRNNNWSRYDDFDYDFRNGRRIAVSRGISPSSRHIWMNGYWEYDRRLRREVWVSGHWAVRKENHRYQDAQYAYFGGVRVWVPGFWIRIS